MLEDIQIIPCDSHPANGYIKMHIKDDGSIQFMCGDCLCDLYKLTPRDKWKDLLTNTL